MSRFTTASKLSKGDSFKTKSQRKFRIVSYIDTENGPSNADESLWGKVYIIANNCRSKGCEIILDYDEPVEINFSVPEDMLIKNEDLPF